MFETNKSWYLLVAKAYVPPDMTSVEFNDLLWDQQWVVGTEALSEPRENAEAFYVMYPEGSFRTAEMFFEKRGIEYEPGDVWFTSEGAHVLTLSDISLEDLQEIKGIGEVLAKDIYWHLRRIATREYD